MTQKNSKELKLINLQSFLNSPKIIKSERENKFLSKIHTCSKCGLSYSFGNMIKNNILSKSCKAHVSEFNSYTRLWNCCKTDFYNPGCLIQCHDIDKHFLTQKPTDFPYFLKYGTQTFGDTTLRMPLLQISLSAWIIISNYDIHSINKKKTAAQDVLIFDTKDEVKTYLDSFDTTKFKSIKNDLGVQFITSNNNNNFFKNLKATLNLDSPTVYLENINYEITQKVITQSVLDDDFLKYSIIRLPLYNRDDYSFNN
jgi:hypothetical protein